MARDPLSSLRMLLAFVFAFLLVGVTQALVSLLSPADFRWLLVFQVAAISGLLAFLLISWCERGLWYVLIIIFIIALAGGVVAAIRKSNFFINFLVVLGVQVLTGGLVILGDELGRSKKILRWALGALGGAFAVFVALALMSLFEPKTGGFRALVLFGIPFMLEIPLAAATAVLITRILLGEPSKPLKEQS